MSWMLIFSYRPTTYWYTVVGFFAISTICRVCILKFMPPEGQQDFQENRIFSPKPRVSSLVHELYNYICLYTIQIHMLAYVLYIHVLHIFV